MRRLRDESGQILFIFALLVPVILGIGAIVVDLGNFYEHRRHLQTQADAAALAGGGAWTFPCNQQVDDNIERYALKYAGPHNADAHRTETGGYTPAPLTPVNAQVGTGANSDVHVTLNAGGFWANGSAPADFTSPAGSVCNAQQLEVKVTEANTKAFFGALHPELKATAKVKLSEALNVDGTLPFAVESPAALPCAWAQFVNETNGQAIGSEIAMQHPTSGPDAGDATVWVLANAASVATPNPGVGVGLRVRFGSCTNGNQQDTVDLASNKGITASQTYDANWQANPTDTWRTPIVGPVTLTPSGTCTDPNFVSTATGPPSGSCTFDVAASVNFHTGGGPVVRAQLDNGAFVTLTASSGVWSGGGFTVSSAAPGPHTVELQWARTTGTWCNGGTGAACTGGTLVTCSSPSGGPFASGNKCQGDFGGDQQYSFGARFDRSGSIIEAQITVGGVQSTTLVANSTVGLNARIRFKDLTAAQPGDPPIAIKDSVQESSNRSGAIDCGQGNSSSGLDSAIVNGCPDPYQINTRNLVCSPTLPPAPALQLPDCVTGVPGNKKVDALDQRIGCTHNYWRDYVGGDTTAIKQGDKRVVPIIITNLGALSRNAGNPQTPLPIIAVAYFYVVGWDGMNCAQNDSPAPGDDPTRSMWGHFITYVAPPSGGTPSNNPCIIGSINACVVSLVE